MESCKKWLETFTSNEDLHCICIAEIDLGGDLDKSILKRMEVHNSTNVWEESARLEVQE